MRVGSVGGWALLAALGVAAVGGAAWPFTVDDAYIVARYAEHLAGGEGYVMNPGASPTDGVTGPAWILPMMAGVGWAKGLGLASAALAAAVATVLAGERGGAVAARATAPFAAVQPTLGIWGVAGLETGAAALALVVAAWGALGRTARPALVAVAGLLMPFLRPEGVPAVLVAGALLWARSRRAGMWAVGSVVAGAVAVAAFRGVMFGHLLPLAAAAKPPSLGAGVAYAGRGLLATTGIVALVPVVWGLRQGDRGVRGLVLVAGVQGVAVVIAGGDWMPGYRLLAPALPVLAAALGLGLVHVFRRWVRAGLLAVALVVPAADLVAQLPDVRDAGARRVRVAKPFGEWLGRRFEHVALVDAGYLPWVGGMRVLDLAGLTDPRVARLPGGHVDKHVPAGLLAAAEPDAIVVHAVRPPEVGPDGRLRALAGYPVERRIVSDPWVRSRYRVARVIPYAPHYHYVVLTRGVN